MKTCEGKSNILYLEQVFGSLGKESEGKEKLRLFSKWPKE